MADVAQAAACPIYCGRDLHAIDAKGRVNIPARHRRVASRRGNLEFWLSTGLEGCVFLWDAQGFMDHASRIESLSSSVEEARRSNRSTFSRATRVEPDNQGRVVIPEQVRSEAELESQVLVLGVQDHLELWNPQAHAAYENGRARLERRSPASLPAKIYGAFHKLENANRHIISFVFDVVLARVPKIKLHDVFEKQDDGGNIVKSELPE